MKGYYHKPYLYFLCVLVLAAVLLVVNQGLLTGSRVQAGEQKPARQVDLLTSQQIQDSRMQVLVLVDEDSEISMKYKKNLGRVLRQLDLEGTFLNAARTDTLSYETYDLVVVAFSDWEELLGDDSTRLLDYVEQGGRLFLGMLPENPGLVYASLYRAMGVMEYGDYKETYGIAFTRELVPGSQGQVFSGENFCDTVLSVQLEEDAQILAEGLIEDRRIPLMWKHGWGEGIIGVFNATAITGDGWTGTAGGCIASLFDALIYPVFNAKVIFIDDFPSPQYNSENPGIEADYNRTVREFFRDIWWPDMQSAARRYGYKYVGLFIATYDDNVRPEDFSYTLDSVEQYFGNSLLDAGYEMGAHGYNHQSLALEGAVPQKLGYHAWASKEDMAASVTALRRIAQELFPGIRLYTYVPPSNYLDETGRQAVKEALPDLQVLSGVYTMEGEEGSVYVQDFGVAEDGIVELPRTTSGMMEDSYDRFVAMNTAGLYGIYSHFVHPDDILDRERSGGKDWQSLYKDFCDKLQFINEHYEGMRGMTALEAAQSVRAAKALDVVIQVGEGRVTGACNGFSGEAWCYFRTEKTPVTDNETCEIRRVCGDYEGDYYLIKIKSPEFSFGLKESQS